MSTSASQCSLCAASEEKQTLKQPLQGSALSDTAQGEGQRRRRREGERAEQSRAPCGVVQAFWTSSAGIFSPSFSQVIQIRVSWFVYESRGKQGTALMWQGGHGRGGWRTAGSPGAAQGLLLHPRSHQSRTHAGWRQIYTRNILLETQPDSAVHTKRLLI